MTFLRFALLHIVPNKLSFIFLNPTVLFLKHSEIRLYSGSYFLFKFNLICRSLFD